LKKPVKKLFISSRDEERAFFTDEKISRMNKSANDGSTIYRT